ncbi:MAG: sensor histidine kinase [Slackia sp.]|nr:sensor histidine kinase [Slackia sp.]
MSDLGDFIERVAGPGVLRVEDDLGNGFVRLRVSEAQRRQAKQDIRCVEDAAIEMLRNARDACAQTIFLAVSRSAHVRTLVVIDDGAGIPLDMHDAVFEPRVTSKLDAFVEDEWGVHGRGMALYSIKENAAEAFVAASRPGKGSAFRVSFSRASVKERKDQSTLPALEKNEEGDWALGPGPRNIVRTAAEFALKERRRCTVYFGSPVEVAATLRAYGMRVVRDVKTGCKNFDDVPYAADLSFCSDAVDFALRANRLGLSVSQRSAYRIMQGDVPPLRPLLAMLRDDQAPEKPSGGKTALAAHDGVRGLKISPEDAEAFSRALKKAWAPLAEAYYLEPDIEPSVRVSRDGVRVVFPAYRQL